MALSERLDRLKNSYQVSKASKHEKTEEAAFPDVTEPALVHPLSSSMVKLRSNGMIDIFVGTDNGIRIDPKTKTISLMSNEIKERTKSKKSTVTRNVDETIGEKWTVKVKSDVLIESEKGSITLKADRDVNILAGNHVNISQNHKYHPHEY